MMQGVVHILENTPAWVYLFFAYILWRGIGALRQRSLPLWRAMIVPAIFIGFGLIRLFSAPGSGAWSLLPWVAGAVLGAGLATMRPPRLLAADHRTGLITQAGSVVPLLRNVLNFALQYGTAIIVARTPGHDQPLHMIAHALSGTSAGYFTVWAALLLRRYRKLAPIAAASTSA